MEEEISLKEIFLTIWQGRYIIITVTAIAVLIALAFSLLFITPQYQSTVHVDLTPFVIENNQVFSQINNQQIEHVLSSSNGQPQQKNSSVSVSEERGQLAITASAPDPQEAASIAEHYRLYALEQIGTIIYEEKEYLENWVSYFDQQLYERYLSQFFQHNANDLQADPAYIYMMEEKGRRLVQLHEAEFRIIKVEGRLKQYEDNTAYAAPVPTEPYNVRWQLNTAVAFVLGLMLSVMVVFVKPYIGELIKEARAAKDNSES